MRALISLGYFVIACNSAITRRRPARRHLRQCPIPTHLRTGFVWHRKSDRISDERDGFLSDYSAVSAQLVFCRGLMERSDLAEVFENTVWGPYPGRRGIRSRSRARSADDMGAEARRSTGMRDKVSRYRSDRRICRAACAPRSVASIVSDVSERSSGARKYSEWRPRRQCRE